MKFRVLGCGDAFGSGGRLNTCFMVEGDRTSFLIDCGATSMVGLRRCGIDPNTISTVFVSHLHGDHFGGLPFLVLDAQFVSRRRAPLVIAGPRSLCARFETLCETMFPGSTTTAREFSLDFVELEAETATTVGAVRVTAFEVRHPSGAPSHAMRFEFEGKVIAFSGDTEWVDAVGRAAAGADLFISEAYTYDRVVPFHTAWMTLKQQLPSIAAKRVLVTHMADEMLRAGPIEFAERAEDGMVLEI